MLITATLVAVIVFSLLGMALLRSRQEQPAERPMKMDSQRFILLCGAVVPAVILVTLIFLMLGVMADLDNPPEEPNTVIEVTGWMWWWDVRYPGTDAVTANEIHIPAGEPVELRVTAADVIHGFWVPELHPQINMTPGIIDTIWIQADEPGIYRGQCTEFCGLQHTFMALLVIAQEPDEFDAWLAAQAEPAPEPSDPVLQRGQQAFLDNQCLFCHAIRGTSAVGEVGPDLTHVMSRETLGAATLDNSVGNLAAWTANPHEFKPGVKMPAVNFESEEFAALIAYLATLE
jgi:cytochrome c oxidase subunit 2